ncbi:MAG: PaaI family thioesterase [Tannerellaceae bacterium]|nr:PaaI family thioesterase [Tannerellaceae bacterium]
MTIQDFLKGDSFALFAGIELVEVAKGYAKARMEIQPMHLNGGRVCQGGAIFTLADLAFAAATNSHGKMTLSVTSTIHFFKAESQGFLYAEAKEILDHKRLSHCEVVITNNAGELVATFTGTGYRKEKILPFEPLE